MARMALILVGILVSAFLVGRVAGDNHVVATAVSQSQMCIAVCVANSSTHYGGRRAECEDRCSVLQ